MDRARDAAVPDGGAERRGEKDAKLAQKIGQFQPLIAAFSQECVGQLGSFGPT
jgi:hypothetical protein